MQHGPAHLQHKMTKWADPYNMGAISKFASCSILKAKVSALIINHHSHIMQWLSILSPIYLQIDIPLQGRADVFH